jgi:hypothetical protein
VAAVVATRAIPVSSRGRSPSTSTPTNDAAATATTASFKLDSSRRPSSPCGNTSNDHAGIALNSAPTTLPSVVGTAGSMAEWWYTCTLFSSATAAERFLRDAAAAAGATATATTPTTHARAVDAENNVGDDDDDDGDDVVTTTNQTKRGEKVAAWDEAARNADAAQRMRFGLRDHVIVFSGSPKGSSTTAGAGGSSESGQASAVRREGKSITPAQQLQLGLQDSACSSLPPPYPPAAVLSGRARERQTRSPVFLYVTPTSNTTTTTPPATAAAGSTFACAAGAYPTTSSGVSARHRAPSVTSSNTTTPHRGGMPTTPPQVSHLFSPSGLEFLPYTGAPQHPNLSTTTTTTFTTYSLHSPPSSSSLMTMAQQPTTNNITSEPFSATLSPPAGQVFVCNDGSNNIDSNISGGGAVRAFQTVSPEPRNVSAPPAAFAYFGGGGVAATPPSAPPLSASAFVPVMGPALAANPAAAPYTLHTPPSASAPFVIANATASTITSVPHLSVSDRSVAHGAVLPSAGLPCPTSAPAGSGGVHHDATHPATATFPEGSVGFSLAPRGTLY